MKTLAFYLTAFAIMFAVGTANAMTIEMLNKDADGNKMIYSEEIAHIAVGRIYHMPPTDKGHNVEIIAAPEGFDIPKKSKNSKEVTIEFTVAYTTTGVHKGMGMIGLVVVGEDTHNKDAVAKAKALGKSKKKLKKLLEDI